MARSFNGSSQYLIRTTNLWLVDSFPFSVSLWFYHTATGVTDAMFGASSGGSEYFLYYITSSNQAAFRVQSIGELTINAQARTANQWQHASGSKLAGSSTDSHSFLDGNKQINNSTLTAPPSGIDNNIIGARDNAGIADHFGGYLAEIAIWNVLLDDTEHVALSKGYNPLLIRPQSLIRYWPVIGRTSPEIERIFGFDMTVTGGPTAIPHPRVIYPAPQLWTPPPPAPAEGLSRRGVGRGIMRGVGRGV